jgi:hypothetical protein
MIGNDPWTTLPGARIRCPSHESHLLFTTFSKVEAILETESIESRLASESKMMAAGRIKIKNEKEILT